MLTHLSVYDRLEIVFGYLCVNRKIKMLAVCSKLRFYIHLHECYSEVE